MLATDILRKEHRVIEQVLGCLEALADDCAAKGKLDAVTARQIIDFFQTFADKCHHLKEETRLFPMLESKGFPRTFGPTSLLRSEHDLGRRFLQSMSASVDGAATGEPDAMQRFASHALAYARFLRAHIDKEDRRLFPMANEALTDEDQRALLVAFEEAENTPMHAGTHEQYLRIADELAERFGVSRAATMSPVVHTCCGHAAVQC
jgi:hemerythrin-like domain-containing protein